MKKDVLVKAFRALNAEQRANLRWHAEHGTRIACGPVAMGRYVSDDGFG